MGHSYLVSARDCGLIEEIIRKHQTISLPDQYRDITMKKLILFKHGNLLYNFEDLRLFIEQKNILNYKTLRDRVKWIRMNEFLVYYYKTSLDPFVTFLQVDLKKKGTQSLFKSEYAPTCLA